MDSGQIGRNGNIVTNHVTLDDGNEKDGARILYQCTEDKCAKGTTMNQFLVIQMFAQVSE